MRLWVRLHVSEMESSYLQSKGSVRSSRLTILGRRLAAVSFLVLLTVSGAIAVAEPPGPLLLSALKEFSMLAVLGGLTCWLLGHLRDRKGHGHR